MYRCKDELNAFSCDCLPGFTDDTCATNIDDCVDVNCVNGGTCVDLVTTTNGVSDACVSGVLR